MQSKTYRRLAGANELKPRPSGRRVLTTEETAWGRVGRGANCLTRFYPK